MVALGCRAGWPLGDPDGPRCAMSLRRDCVHFAPFLLDAGEHENFQGLLLVDERWSLFVQLATGLENSGVRFI